MKIITITSNKWVPHIFSECYILPYISPPSVNKKGVETLFPAALPKHEALWMEVWSLLDKGAIEIELSPGKGGGGWSTPTTSMQPRG